MTPVNHGMPVRLPKTNERETNERETIQRRMRERLSDKIEIQTEPQSSSKADFVLA
jgi:hypothetical protein